MSSIGTYDPNWDHRSDMERLKDQSDPSDALEEVVRKRLELRSTTTKYYDVMDFIQERDLRGELKEWLYRQYSDA